jgi:hypothetical protein
VCVEGVGSVQRTRTWYKRVSVLVEWAGWVGAVGALPVHYSTHNADVQQRESINDL